jgi:hypothetical protein
MCRRSSSNTSKTTLDISGIVNTEKVGSFMLKKTSRAYKDMAIQPQPKV